MNNCEEAHRVWGLLRAIPDQAERLRAACILLPPDTVQASLRLAEPRMELHRDAAVFRFLENGALQVECIPAAQYCSCSGF